MSHMSHGFTELHSKNWTATCWHSWFLSCKLCSKKLNLGAWMASGCHNIQQHTAAPVHTDVARKVWVQDEERNHLLERGCLPTTCTGEQIMDSEDDTDHDLSSAMETWNRCSKTWGVSRGYSLLNGRFVHLAAQETVQNCPYQNLSHVAICSIWNVSGTAGRCVENWPPYQAFLTTEFGHLQTIMRINQVRYLSVDTSMAWSTIFNWKPCLDQSLVVMKSQAFAEPHSSSPGHNSCGQAMIKSDKVHLMTVGMLTHGESA